LNCNFHEACKHERDNLGHTPKIFGTINSITSHRGVDMGVKSHLQTATHKIQAATQKDRTRTIVRYRPLNGIVSRIMF
jgi:hypothetical protein